MNANLLSLDTWDEEAIDRRARWLASKVDAELPGPDSPRWQPNQHNEESG